MDRSTTCIACGNRHSNTTFYASEKMLGLGGKFLYLNCGSCRAVQIVDVPSDLSEFYPIDYYAFGGMVRRNTFLNYLKKIRWRLFKNKIFAASNPQYYPWLISLEAKEDDKIADIGCGNGQILYEFKCSGFKHLFGFDPYLSKEVFEPGFTLQKKGLFDIEATFDIIMLHHSFEHMDNPQQVMSQLTKLLNPKGKLLIRVPVTDAEVWKKESVNWFQLDAPRHLFIPSVKTMEMLGKSSGLELKKVVFDSTMYQFVITELYKRGKKFLGFNWKGEFTASQLNHYKQLAEEYNLQQKGDQVCLYFVKQQHT